MLTEEQVKEWKENPISEIFFKYLADQVKETSTLLAERIADGGVVYPEEQIQISTECVTLQRITEIDASEINEFYEEPRDGSTGE